MILNKFFFGENSAVEIKTTETLDEVKSKLSSKYIFCTVDPKKQLGGFERDQDFTTEYVYYLKNKNLRIYFSKALNRKFVSIFSTPYPSFDGELIDHGDHRLIKGVIVPSYWTYSVIFAILWHAFVVYAAVSRNPDPIPLCLLCVGLISSLIYIIRVKKYVDILSDEIENRLNEKKKL